MEWHHKYIDNPTLALVESRQYMDAITPFFAVQENQRTCAIFARLDEETGGVHYYFTPAAKPIAIAFKAEPCNKPTKSEIGSLLVGDSTLINRLYG